MTQTLSFEAVPYSSDFRLSSSTLWQIVRGIVEIKKNLTDPKNDYQKVMYPLLTELINNIESGFLLLLDYENDDEREVIEYHLGVRGKLPQQIKMSFHHKIKIGNSNFEPLLKAATQRINFIVNRRIPPHYLTDENINKLLAFNKFRLNMEIFNKLFEATSQEWVSIVKTTRNNTNVGPSKRFSENDKDRIAAKRYEEYKVSTVKTTRNNTNAKPSKRFSEDDKDRIADERYEEYKVSLANRVLGKHRQTK